MRISIHYQSGMKSLFTGIDSSRNTAVASAHACQVIFILSVYLLYCHCYFFQTFHRFRFRFRFRFPFHFRFRFSNSASGFRIGMDTLCSLK